MLNWRPAVHLRFMQGNHTQWQGVNLSCNGSPNADGSPAFDRSCGGHQYNLGNGQVISAWPARIMQFPLKFMF